MKTLILAPQNMTTRSYLLPSPPRAQQTGNYDFAWAMLVLETVMDESDYCAEYPADGTLVFGNVTLDGAAVSWDTTVTKTECAQDLQVTAAGDIATLTWNPN